MIKIYTDGSAKNNGHENSYGGFGVIILKDNYSIATVERAFLDMIYLFPDYYFDNLDLIDFEKCNKIVHIYNNKELIKRLKKYAE